VTPTTTHGGASAETINGLCKAQVDDGREPWRSFEVVEFATHDWVAWFNNRRVLEPIGQIPPSEAEARYYATKEPPDMTAYFKSNSRRQTRRGSPCQH
jgi:transposase InsO family protein